MGRRLKEMRRRNCKKIYRTNKKKKEQSFFFLVYFFFSLSHPSSLSPPPPLVSLPALSHAIPSLKKSSYVDLPSSSSSPRPLSLLSW